MSMSPDNSYRETIEYLYALQKHGVKLALSNSVALMELMGNPHRKFPSVHVAGTNGKGSTSAFIASVLRSAGYRVGLYTSPHLISFPERIRINNVPITEAKTVELAQRVRKTYQQQPAGGAAALNPTFFEVTTAMAFTHFAEEGVDIAVVETGMGGRLDATNVITPLVTVITNVDLEHTEYLGNTLELIAGEKAGIIKTGVPLVTGVIQPEVIRVIEREAAASGVPIYRLDRDFSAERVSSDRGQRFHYRGIKTGYDLLMIALLGGYQVDNACLALAAIECVRDAGMTVGEEALRRGLEQAQWEGRLERVSHRPDIYLDGAHNPASARMLAAAVRDMKRAYRRLVLVLGILGDKDFRGIIAELVPLADRVIVTRPEYSRAMDLGALAEEVRALHGTVDTAETVEKAVSLARADAAPEDMILVTGSLYVVGDARAALVGRDERAKALSGLKG
jgi:dihydrofolate synthase/folylpolyglutamate synthase